MQSKEKKSNSCLKANTQDVKSVHRTYISLFSSAGVGCYGFMEERFDCVATVELEERRLNIQRFNHKCRLNSGYICGDMLEESTKDKIRSEIGEWKCTFGIDDIDVIIATPPCQGMSVANHKKKDELPRNSLVVESIKLIDEIKPRFFVMENVLTFLNAECVDMDGAKRKIGEAIDITLSGKYNILAHVINFKDYGAPSSRTRTLVLGVRKDIKDITPYDIMPKRQQPHSLREVIGHLRPLKTMGEISDDDIYHNFKSYPPFMECWIADLKEGQSAFDNVDPMKRPHTIRNGVIAQNVNKNGDKYKRQCWDAAPPCVHTRNDILSSQNTIHPSDNRVFSIREVSLMMSVPVSFKWTSKSLDELNVMSYTEKKAFLKKEEMNIRRCLGDAVPTVIFQQIASNINRAMDENAKIHERIEAVLRNKERFDCSNLLRYINDNLQLGFSFLSKVAEMANDKKSSNAAFYTRQDVCYAVMKRLPDAKQFTLVSILEPAVGVGNFLPVLIQKYSSVQKVVIDVVDIDGNSINILKALLKGLSIGANITINFINDDFLLHAFSKHYDIVVGNPPYMKITRNKALLAKYKQNAMNKDTNNIFSFFIEKALGLGDTVAFIVPKSLIGTPEFNKTREVMNKNRITHIVDYGESAFKGVRIETISFVLQTDKKPLNTAIESYINETFSFHRQDYIADSNFPYWLIYRNEEFDCVAEKMQLDIFTPYRDRKITKAVTKPYGFIRVLKSRNIGSNKIIDIAGYDCYVDDAAPFAVSKYMNKANCVLLPNLSYAPRACFLPKDSIADGSVAILTLKDDNETITEDDIAFYATVDFKKFYAIARNLGTRSLNIDSNSVFFFGKRK